MPTRVGSLDERSQGWSNLKLNSKGGTAGKMRCGRSAASAFSGALRPCTVNHRHDLERLCYATFHLSSFCQYGVSMEPIQIAFELQAVQG